MTKVKRSIKGAGEWSGSGIGTTRAKIDAYLDENLTEEQEQIRFFVWLDKRNILAFAIPNAAKRSMSLAMKMRRAGLRAGVPDVFIPYPRHGFGGLFIEMKRKEGGVISERQKFWLKALEMLGYKAVVCRGATEAIRMVEEYLGDDYVMPGLKIECEDFDASF